MANGEIITVGHGSGYDYYTITEALNVAQPGDKITVADGNYTASNGELFPLLRLYREHWQQSLIGFGQHLIHQLELIFLLCLLWS